MAEEIPHVADVLPLLDVDGAEACMHAYSVQALAIRIVPVRLELCCGAHRLNTPTLYYAATAHRPFTPCTDTVCSLHFAQQDLVEPSYIMYAIDQTQQGTC